MDVITTHTNADFDCLGAMVAAARLYPGALISFPGSQEKAVRDFLAVRPEYLTGVVRAKDIDLDAITRLIIVDCQHGERIGRFASILERPGIEIHIYDHHPITEQSIRPTGGIICPRGSSSTILAGLLMEQAAELTPEEATLIMLGIHEDTGRLLFASTTRDDYRVAAWLMEFGRAGERRGRGPLPGVEQPADGAPEALAGNAQDHDHQRRQHLHRPRHERSVRWRHRRPGPPDAGHGKPRHPLRGGRNGESRLPGGAQPYPGGERRGYPAALPRGRPCHRRVGRGARPVVAPGASAPGGTSAGRGQPAGLCRGHHVRPGQDHAR